MSGLRRVGLFGGTFNPIHEGHLDLARACLRELELDEVRCLASQSPPHKRAPGVSGYRSTYSTGRIRSRV